MKKIIFTCLMAFCAIAAFGQNTENVKDLKQQQKVLDLTSKLNKLQLKYEKEKANYDLLNDKTATANATANSATTDFSTSDASSTVKDAKETVKALKEAKKINKKLAKSQKKLKKLEKKMAKIQARIDDMNKKIKFVDQQSLE